MTCRVCGQPDHNRTTCIRRQQEHVAKIEAMLEEAKAELARRQRRLQDYYYNEEKKETHGEADRDCRC